MPRRKPRRPVDVPQFRIGVEDRTGPIPLLIAAPLRPGATSTVLVIDRGDDEFLRPVAAAVEAGEPIPPFERTMLYRFDGTKWELVASRGYPDCALAFAPEVGKG